MVKAGDTIAVWFSCGAASAVAAKLTIDKYGKDCIIRVMNNPVIEEDQDNRRFLKDCEKWLGVEIEIVTNKDFPNASANEIWKKRKYMSGVEGAPCTTILKKQARQQWEDRNKHDWLVLGFTADEKGRHDKFVSTERSNLLPILIDAGLTKKDCWRIIEEAGIGLPFVYKMGYPNANCIGCVKATSPTYWNHVRVQHPDVFMQRALLSRELGCKLTRVNGKRIYLDELPIDYKGRDMKSMTVDCGIFCEEGAWK